jgi:hypothetical protein
MLKLFVSLLIIDKFKILILHVVTYGLVFSLCVCVCVFIYLYLLLGKPF